MSSPAPLSTATPAARPWRTTSPTGPGTMAVTPVRATPRPAGGSGSSRQTVVWPTRTPGTSVMALPGPGGSRPISMPRSRARARGVGAGIRRTVPSRPPGGFWRGSVSLVRRSRARPGRPGRRGGGPERALRVASGAGASRRVRRSRARTRVGRVWPWRRALVERRDRSRGRFWRGCVSRCVGAVLDARWPRQDPRAAGSRYRAARWGSCACRSSGRRPPMPIASTPACGAA